MARRRIHSPRGFATTERREEKKRLGRKLQHLAIRTTDRLAWCEGSVLVSQKRGCADEVEVVCLRVQAWNCAREFDRRCVGSRQIAWKTRSFRPIGIHRARRVVGKGRPQRGHGIYHGAEWRLSRERLGKIPERLLLSEITRLERYRSDLLQILFVMVRIFY